MKYVNILILEDSVERIDTFKRNLSNKNTTLYFTDEVKVAKDLINKIDFDIMFLDHDLDQRDSISSDEVNTGYKFAKELINYYSAKERLHKPVVYVHSLNPVGSENMMNILKDNLFDAFRRPFTTLF